MGIYAKDVQKLYIAYFNRPADVLGLAYWEAQVANNGGSTAAVANAFSASQEYKDLYAGKSTAQIIDAIYQNLFGRAAEPDGLVYWGTRLDNGTFNIGNIAISIMVGAQGTDKSVIDNKTTAADSFTTNLDTAAEIIAYSGNAANATAKAWLSTVADTAASLTTAQNSLNTTISTIASTTIANGQTFTLTTGTDVMNGSSANDSFVATDSSYTTGDQINGGAGTDSLSLTLGAATNAVVSVSGVENVKISDFGGATVNAAAWSGVTSIEFANSTAATTVTNLAAIPTVTLTKTANDVTVTMAAAAVAGANDAATVNLNGLTDSTKTFTMNGIETLTLNATGAASKVRIADTGLKTVVVTGDQKLDVSAAALASTVTSVDASAKTAGGFLANLDGATLTSVKGGAGADTFLLGATAVGTTVIDGGAGNDTLGLNVANVAGLLSTSSKVTNIETLKVQDAVTVAGATAWDLSKVAGLTNVTFGAALTTDAAGTGVKALTIAGLASGSALTFTSDVTDTNTGAGTAFNAGLVATVTGAGDAGTNDTINLVFNKGASAAAAQGFGGMTVANVENVVVDVKNLTGATTTITGIADSQLAKLTIGSSAVDSTGAATKAAALTLGSGFTSTVINSVDLSGYTAGATDVVNVSSLSGNLIATGATIKGPAGGILVATGGAGADLIVTGAGGSASGNGLTGGAGADTFDLTASVAKADIVTIASGDSSSTITDQVKGFTTSATASIADTLNIVDTTVAANAAAGTVTSIANLTGQVASGIVTFGGTAAATATLSQLIQATQDLIGANAKVAAFVYNGDTYVVDNVDASATVSAADIVVKLVGVTDATSVATTAGAHAILIA